MNVAYVSYEFPGFRSWGGAATSTLMVAKSLSLQDLTLTMYIAGDSDRSVVFSSNVNIEIVECSDVSGFRERVAKRVLEHHLIRQFDVIESCDGDGQGYMVAESIPGVPFVTRSHTPLRMIHHYNRHVNNVKRQIDQMRLFFLTPFRRFIQKRYSNDLEFLQFRKSDVISCSSKLLSKSLTLFYPIDTKQAIVPYAIDCARVVEPKRPSGPIKFGFVGSIDNRKGLIELLDAIEVLLERGHSLEFKFAGKMCLSGYPFEKFKMLTDKYSDFVSYIGEIDYCDIHAVFDDIDVLVLPSRFDSYGYVCMEASLNGCGLICSNSVGASELLENVDSMCIHDSHSCKSLVRSMLHLVELYSSNPFEFTRRIKAIQANTISKHSLDNAGAIHVALLRQVSALNKAM
jgi:glycogen(starch) synthase